MINQKLIIILSIVISISLLLFTDNQFNSKRQFDIPINKNINFQKVNNTELLIRLKLFITIFNSNSKSQLKNYLKENFNSSYRGRMNTKLKSKSNYWHKLYKEIGPIDFVKILHQRMDKCTTEQFWASSTLTALNAFLLAQKSRFLEIAPIWLILLSICMIGASEKPSF